MFDKNKHFFDSKASWLASLSLVILLYLIYSPTFLTDYLMNDEWALIGNGSLNVRHLPNSAANSFLFYGRGIYGIFEQLVYGFVGYDPFRIQIVRFINFVSLAAIAVILFRFIGNRLKNRTFAFFVILLLFSLPAFQGAMGYSLQLVSTNVSALWLSLLAFYLHFFTRDRHKFPKLLNILAVFFALMLAMQSNQTYAFFALAPLAILALTEWDSRKYQVLSFLGIVLAVFLLSTIIYRVGLEFLSLQGQGGYETGAQALDSAIKDPFRVILKAINPFSYWSVFKIWTYPFPLHYTLPLGEMKRIIASFVLVVWLALILASIITEVLGSSADEKRQILFKWLVVLACLGFAGVFMVADSPVLIIEHRPHLTMTFVGIVIFSGAYGIQVLASEYQFLRNKSIVFLGMIFVMLTSFGAQADVLRGIVNNRMEQISFIRTELMARNPADYNNIFVVLPGWSGCVTEPCGPWMGHATSNEWHVTREGVYRYALETIDVPSKEKEITFINQKPDQIPADSVIIDWNQYASAHHQQFEYLRNDN